MLSQINNFFTAIFLPACLLLCSCNTLPTHNTSLSPTAQQLESQTRQFERTVSQSAFIGALIGAGGGLLHGGNRESAVKGAIIGAVSGATFGYYIAGQQQKFTQKEQALNTISKDLEEDNRRLSIMIGTSERMLAEDLQQVKQLRQQIAAGNQQQAYNRNLLAQLKSDRRTLNKAIAATEKRYNASLHNITTYEKQFGVTGLNKLKALLDHYRSQQDILASREQTLGELIGNVETTI